MSQTFVTFRKIKKGLIVRILAWTEKTSNFLKDYYQPIDLTDSLL